MPTVLEVPKECRICDIFGLKKVKCVKYANVADVAPHRGMWARNMAIALCATLAGN